MKETSQIPVWRRWYSVMELRTGFATGLPILSGGLFGAYLVGELDWLALLLFFIVGFTFNIVANIANELRAYLAKEEDETTFTNHTGSEGLVRGYAKVSDAIYSLLLMLIIGATSGLVLVYYTQKWYLLFWGVLALLAAITYSLGPFPYLVLPIGEIVSGFFAGGLSCYLSGTLQTGGGNLLIVLYSLIAMIFTIFLMATNNLGDFQKDLGTRVTLPHVIGFRPAIMLIIPEGLLAIGAWTFIVILGGIPLFQYLIGLVIFYRQGYQRWYKDFFNIQEVYPEMGKEYGPRPLLLIYHFHGWMAFLFLLQLLGGV